MPWIGKMPICDISSNGYVFKQRKCDGGWVRCSVDINGAYKKCRSGDRHLVYQASSSHQTVKNLKLTKATAMKEATMPLMQSTAGRMAGQRWVSRMMASRVG